jgi:hypothetical protein
MKGTKKSKAIRDSERDVSEKIALGNFTNIYLY